MFYHYLRQNQNQNRKIITQETIKPCVPVKVEKRKPRKVKFFFARFFLIFLFFQFFLIDSKYILFS